MRSSESPKRFTAATNSSPERTGRRVTYARTSTTWNSVDPGKGASCSRMLAR